MFEIIACHSFSVKTGVGLPYFGRAKRTYCTYTTMDYTSAAVLLVSEILAFDFIGKMTKISKHRFPRTKSSFPARKPSGHVGGRIAQ